MSGPKSGHATLNREREAALRRQRERDERVRRAKETQKRDEQRERALQEISREVRSRMQQVQDALREAQNGSEASYAASEMREWQRQIQAAQQAVQQMESALDKAQQAFQRATSSWKSNDEQYDSGHFDRVDFKDARRAIDEAIQEGKRIRGIAEARREEERIRREMERQQAEAQAAVLQARTARQHFADLPHAALAPGAMPDIDRQIERANRSIEQGEYTTATQAARQANQMCAERIRDVQAAYTTWNKQCEAARAALEATQQAMASLDHDFVSTWARDEFDAAQTTIEAIAQEFAAMQQPTRNTASYTRIVQQCGEGQAAIEAAQARANERHAEEMRRETIVDAILDVLEGMHFNVGVELRDESDPLSDVMISAGHPSGQEVSMQVDTQRTVRMNMEDGVKGANCVADVYKLIEGLQRDGIELEITDWGTADPDRVKRGGTYFSTGAGTATGAAGRDTTT